MSPACDTIGKNVAFVGNRGDSTVCAFDAGTLAKRGCVTLDSMPDGRSNILTVGVVRYSVSEYVERGDPYLVAGPRDQDHGDPVPQCPHHRPVASVADHQNPRSSTGPCGA